MRERGLVCKCLRCREAGHRPKLPADTKPTLFVETYENAGGQEYFLSIEDPGRTTVMAFLRLRLPDHQSHFEDAKTQKMLDEVRRAFPELDDSAYVRELHTYGQALDLDQLKVDAQQHRGLGRQLMAEAEKIAREQGYRSMNVISGIGVREYYRDLGYRLAGTYMRKSL
ncbi:GNAT family N-acetyltransferase [Candidatus Uhrbacteria bacterium]|nr:GNAT family N-acetyltransferase [Candidatus Uhrbacteria bacterium]